MGIDLLSALEKVSEWSEGASEQLVEKGAFSHSAVSSRQNEQSMELLKGMLAKVENAPTKKPRRA